MIIITGASDGLGREVAKLYLSEDKKVICLARNPGPENSDHIKVDLKDIKSIESATKKLLAMNEPFEALINCAGIIRMQPPAEIVAKDIHDVYAVNVEGPMLLASRLTEKIKASNGDVLNVSSTVGTVGRANEWIYSSSKWAMRGLSAGMQDLFKDTSVRVISFCPGGFKSKLFEKGTGIDNTGDGSEWMNVEDVALLLKQMLDLPKNMQVSEIIIQRKTAK